MQPPEAAPGPDPPTTLARPYWVLPCPLPPPLPLTSGQQRTPTKQGRQPPPPPTQGGPQGLGQLSPQREPRRAPMLTPVSADWGGQVMNSLAGP